MSFDHPLDFGIIQGSTNNDIWEAEMTRHAGFEALRLLGKCPDPEHCAHKDEPEGGIRQHVQSYLRAFTPAQVGELVDALAMLPRFTDRGALVEAMMNDRRVTDAARPLAAQQIEAMRERGGLTAEIMELLSGR